MKCIRALLVTAVTVLVIPPADAKEDSPLEIMTRSYQALQLSGAESVATLTIYSNRGSARMLKMTSISKQYEGGAQGKRLILFLSPSNVKGMGLLTVDHDKSADEIWLYMPALRKVRRVLGGQKAKSFMGSEFLYADLAPPRLEDFRHRLLKPEQVRQIPCWVIESIPNNEEIAEENGFAKRVTYLSQTDYVVRRSLYYDAQGKLEKELNVHQVQLIDKVKRRYQMTHMEMVNKQTGRRSVLVVDKVQQRNNVPDDYFLRFLQRQ